MDFKFIENFNIYIASKNETDLENKPVIIIKLDQKENYFIVKNIGKQTALHIVMEYFEIFMEDQFVVYRLDFEPVNLLEQNEEKRVTHVPYANGKRMSPDATFVFNYITSRYTKVDLPFAITYKDIAKHKYWTKLSIGKSGILIKDISKKSFIKSIFYEVRAFIRYRYIVARGCFVRKFKYKLDKKKKKV